MSNDNININFMKKKKKINNNTNNLLQGSPNLSRHPSFNSRYYDSVGANLYSSPKVDPSSQGR